MSANFCIAQVLTKIDNNNFVASLRSGVMGFLLLAALGCYVEGLRSALLPRYARMLC